MRWDEWARAKEEVRVASFLREGGKGLDLVVRVRRWQQGKLNRVYWMLNINGVCVLCSIGGVSMTYVCYSWRTDVRAGQRSWRSGRLKIFQQYVGIS